MCFDELPALPRRFYLQDTVQVARQLLNCVLIHRCPEGLTAGRIAETEAYTNDDPASHSYRGPTRRNTTMFGLPGHAYIYFTYGAHHCFNAVTAPEGVGEAVLIRAVAPLDGLELMAIRRGLVNKRTSGPHESPSKNRTGHGQTRHTNNLCGGPGMLCQAYGMSRSLDGMDLTTADTLWIAAPLPEFGCITEFDIVTTSRIGITKAAEAPWRFYLKDDPYISRR